MRNEDAEKDFETAKCIGSHWSITQHRLSASHGRKVPKACVAGGQAVGWIETEVEEWIARQIEVSREIRSQRTGVNPLSSR
jgi:hypothetical protein